MIFPFKDKNPQIAPDVFIAHNADVIGDVIIGTGSSVWFHSIIRGDVHYIRIGDRTNLQDHTVIHVTSGTHPTVVGDEVTVGHRVTLHGCEIKNRALIGMGSTVLDGAVVGEEAMIGAGSLVTPGTQIPPRVLALGAPCRVIRELKPEEVQQLEVSALHYQELARNYLAKSQKPGAPQP